MLLANLPALFIFLKRKKKKLHPSTPTTSLNFLETEYEQNPSGQELFKEFLQVETYHRSFVTKLLYIAKGHAGDSWNVRQLATLMLQHQVRLLPPNKSSEFNYLFTQLKLKTLEATTVKDDVLKEGYTTTDLGGFIVEFRRKLERFHRVHAPINGRATSVDALRAFIHLSRQDCKLSLARYLFTPEEVVDQILKHVRVSVGRKPKRNYAKEAARAENYLPEYEARILSLLCRDARLYWVAEHTSSSLNALIEYPLTTVVLVVKPPGSELELEIKRAGRKGLHLLNVVFKREGKIVPISHRLDGGSKNRNLEWEAAASSLFSKIFRRVHGRADRRRG